MFELSVAWKYLIPRWRQLSVSIISLISVLVIALVVWLIVVFFSVTNGLEKIWVDKLIALTAPVRVTPTENYYRSYYHQIDSISSRSNYSYKNIKEKQLATQTDPYDPQVDEQLPKAWAQPDRNQDGSLKDLVKLAFVEISSLKGFSGLSAVDFEMTFSNLRLQLVREVPVYFNASSLPKLQENQNFLSQAAYLGSFDSNNRTLLKTILPIQPKDLTNLLAALSRSSENAQKDIPELASKVPNDVLNNRLHTFFDHAKVKSLKTGPSGWSIPKRLLAESSHYQVCAIFSGSKVQDLLISKTVKEMPALLERLKNAGFEPLLGELKIENGLKVLFLEGIPPIALHDVPLTLESDTLIDAELLPNTLDTARTIDQIQFHIRLLLQNHTIEGDVFYNDLEIGEAAFTKQYADNPTNPPLWLYEVKNQLTLPYNPTIGDGILLPKNFKDSGVMLGDPGYLSYYNATTSSVQEQRLPIYVAGFYDPGIIPIGGKFLLVNSELTSLIVASYNQEDPGLTGINVRFDHLDQADEVKKQLIQAFKKQGIDRYWKVETYRDFEFTKDLIQQIQSDKTLFMLISVIIILVACSNIISMLIILVNDKKIEIGILRSMGASSASIALIFGLCGMVMGIVGSCLGTLAAIATLKNLHVLVSFLSSLQGHQAFNTLFYGEQLPHELSYEALGFVMAATAILSLLAGLIPAVKASLMRPSAILRSE